MEYFSHRPLHHTLSSHHKTARKRLGLNHNSSLRFVFQSVSRASFAASGNHGLPIGAASANPPGSARRLASPWVRCPHQHYPHRGRGGAMVTARRTPVQQACEARRPTDVCRPHGTMVAFRGHARGGAVLAATRTHRRGRDLRTPDAHGTGLGREDGSRLLQRSRSFT